MKKAKILISLLLFYSLHASADYRPLKLYRMILEADKIIHGTIIRVDKSYFYLEDTTSLKRKRIKIRKFQNWACASRFEEYEIGQNVLLFLEKEGSYFKIMSPGGEGEIPIINDSVSFRLLNSVFLPYKPNKNQPLFIRDSLIKYKFLRENYYYNAQFKIPLPEVLSVIKALKHHFPNFESYERWCKEFHEKQQNLNITIPAGSFLELLFKGMLIDGNIYYNLQRPKFILPLTSANAQLGD